MSKELSWGKLIMGSAIGTVIGYLSLLLCCCAFYLILFVVIAIGGRGATINTTGLYNQISPMMNTVTK